MQSRMPISNLLYVLFLTWAVSLLQAQTIESVYDFEEETKIKGGFTVVGDELFFVADKGGAHGAGYIGSYNPSTQSVMRQFEFEEETKVKGGFFRENEHSLLFTAEKGGANQFGYIGRFLIGESRVENLYDFTEELKPKTGLTMVEENAYIFATDKGGTGDGFLGRWTPSEGVSVVANFNPERGVKTEAALVPMHDVVYYVSKEGGNLDQHKGKGAGVIGKIDLVNKEISPLILLDESVHGFKVKGWHRGDDERLYYLAEEGGRMEQNDGKGSGVMGVFNPQEGSLTVLHAFDEFTSGVKPKGAPLKIGDRLYYTTSEGGVLGFGTFGYVTTEGEVVVLADLDSFTGAKSESYLTHFSNRIYFPTELGGAHFLGTIVAYSLPYTEPVVPVLDINMEGDKIHVTWSTTGAPGVYELQMASDFSLGEWHPVEADNSGRFTLERANRSMSFFRLVQE